MAIDIFLFTMYVCRRVLLVDGSYLKKYFISEIPGTISEGFLLGHGS